MGIFILFKAQNFPEPFKTFCYMITMQHTEVSAVRGPAHHYCVKHVRPSEFDHIANDKVSTSGRSSSHTKFRTCAEMKPSIRLYMCE